MVAIKRNCPGCGKNGVPRLQGDGNYYCPYCDYQYAKDEIIIEK